jgi:hypothetical protein
MKEELFVALENHNVPPAIPKVGEPVFGDDYNWAERDRVLRLIERVASRAEGLWPQLVGHLTDERYCITWGSSQLPQNLSVGDMCRYIISNNLAAAYYQCLPDDSELALRTMSGPDVVRKGPEALKAWCQQRNDKRLYELQIEMCEWAIPTLAGIGDVSDEERRESIAAMRATIESLRTSKKAVPKPSFFRTIREIWGLPGPDPAEGTWKVDAAENEEPPPIEMGDGGGFF